MNSTELSKNQPYTYLIGWSKYNKWYYGVRYSKKCSPSDLWKTYFSSSNHVKQFREIHGDPDIIQIRRTFINTSSALLWETRVLKRMKVISDSKWLNATDNKAISDIYAFSSHGNIWINNGVIEKYIKNDCEIPEGWIKGRIYKKRKKRGTPSDETILKIKKALTGKRKPQGHGKKVGDFNRGKKRSIKICENISKARKGIPTNIKVWYFTIDDKIIKITNLSKYCRENNLNVSCMRDVHYGNQKQHKNYKKAI